MRRVQQTGDATHVQEALTVSDMTEAERKARVAAADRVGGAYDRYQSMVLGQAESKVMRRLLFQVAGSEEAYWNLVREEIER